MKWSRSWKKRSIEKIVFFGPGRLEILNLHNRQRLRESFGKEAVRSSVFVNI